MSEEALERVRDIAEYLGVLPEEGADVPALARIFGCDESYVLAEPEPPATAARAFARMGNELSERDRAEAERFAAYLAHATDD